MADPGGLLRPIVYFEGLMDVMKYDEIYVEAGKPVWFNSHFEVGDVYIMLLSAVDVIGLRLMFLSFASYNFLPHMKYTKKKKFYENLFLAMFYVFSTIFGVYTLLGEEWTWRPFTNDPEAMVTDLFDPFPPAMSPRHRAFYSTQIGFYVGLLATLFFETRRSDFLEYTLHHVATLSLLFVSATFGVVRLGLVVLILHDFTDIFLHSAKTFHYAIPGVLDTALFAMFSIAFFVARLIVFPRLLWTVGVEVLHYCGNHPRFNDWTTYFDTYLPLWLAGCSLLAVIFLLNCFWMNLISLMIVRELTNPVQPGESYDTRSDDESD